MPFYEYRCKVCGERFSVLVSLSEKGNVQCPKCGAKNVRRLISPFAVKSFFKSCGSGGKTPTGG